VGWWALRRPTPPVAASPTSGDSNATLRTRFGTGQALNLTYDYENRLTAVSGGASQTFIYDGDGKLVKRGTTTLIGNWYEYTGGAAKKYYYAGATRGTRAFASTTTSRAA